MFFWVGPLVKNPRTIPGHKMLFFFSSVFPFPERRDSDLTATIDACNKSNVAVYSLDVRGLQAPNRAGSSMNRRLTRGALQSVAVRHSQSGEVHRARLILAAYPQRPGGGGTGGGTGGTGGGRGGTGGTGGTGGGRGGTGGTGGTGG